jgi:membrane protease YdiL (CAAX protease family)
MVHPADNASPSAPSRTTVLAIAFVVTFAAHAIPQWPLLMRVWRELGGETRESYQVFCDLVMLCLGLILALTAPRRSGLVLGELGRRRRWVLIVAAAPILIAAVVYPNLPERPFGGQAWSMWANSPLAQNLVFAGFLYGQLDAAFPGFVHPRIRLTRAIVLTSMFFALWHVPNLASDMSVQYLLFQLAYTGLGSIVAGLPRQWTGSLIYGVVTHTCVNFIAWVSS